MTDDNGHPPTSGSWRPRTLAVRGGHVPTAEAEQAEPLFPSSSFRFASAAQAARRFAGDEPGNVYSRFTNPTVRLFEQRLAGLEGAEAGVATSSGMAAMFATVMATCRQGDRVVVAPQLFGATWMMFDQLVGKYGIEAVVAADAEPRSWAQAAGDGATLFIVESPSNPQLEPYDIKALAAAAHAAGAWLAVDNCVCTPVLQRPLALGADLVLHSGTKYIDGQGRVLGGFIGGGAAIIDETIRPFLRLTGMTLSPFNAWLLAKGLETMDLRVREQSRVAGALAAELAGHAGIVRVCHPFMGRAADLARAQQRDGGGLLSLELAGGREAAFRFLDALEIVSLTANFGDTKSTATHPATTTHNRIPPERRAQIGIGEGLVRLSIGLEDPDDLRADIARGLAAATG